MKKVLFSLIISAAFHVHAQPAQAPAATDKIYRVDVVTPPGRPLDTPLFPVYLWITGLGVAVNAFIWLLIWRQTKLNEHQVRINIVTAKAAMKSARAAKSSADAAQQTVSALERQLVEMANTTGAAIKGAEAASINSDALITSQRAWIMVSLTNVPGYGFISTGTDVHGEHTAIYIRIECKNDGETPAWITEKRARFEIRGPHDPLPLNPNLETMEIIQAEPEPVSAGETTRLDTTVTALGQQGIGLGESAYVYGVVRYNDAFGHARETRFGFRFVGSRRFERISSYPEYNKNT